MFKIVERFGSFQGEGLWTGTPMFFIRLSQCPVGGQSGLCHAWDGHEFRCDTGPDWHKEGSLEWHSYTEVNETLDARGCLGEARRQGYRHFCITGGEPAIYKLEQLLEELQDGEMLHVETSGTEPMPVLQYGKRIQLWVTLSPKLNWREDIVAYADEFKVLIHQGSDPTEAFKWKMRALNRPLFFQPIDDEFYSLNLVTAMQFATTLHARLGLQLHKMMGVR